MLVFTASPCRSRSFAVVLALAWISAAPLLADEFDLIDTLDLTGVDPVNSNPYRVEFHPNQPLGYVVLSGKPGFPPEDSNGSTLVEFDLNTREIQRQFEV